MAMLIYGMGGSGTLTAQHNLPKPPSLSSSSSLRRSISYDSSSRNRRSTHVAQARKGLSSRIRRLEKRGKKDAVTTTKEEEVVVGAASSLEIGGEGGGGEMEYSSGPPPKLEGLEPDFWEGPQWNAFGFFVQYMWAFGIVFGLIACGIAVATYNEGATDFKKTTVYKESVQSRELLEEPEASNSDVFEGNPTEDAPSLE